jgi:serine/threonine protein phosphatase PrpC
MNIEVGISEEIGWRDRMEDDHAIYAIEKRSFFSAEVYDGHGGKTAATMSAEMLTPYFLHSLEREEEKPIALRRTEEELLREVYLTLDRYLVTRGIDCGTTAATFYILKERFIAANVGDSRVVIATNKGPYTLTMDHKPNLPEEQARIEALGGSVITFGVPRLQGVLAMSRALGDPSLKPYVSAEPRILSGTLGSENTHAVLACDGVWDVLTPEQVMEYAKRADDPESAAASIEDAARHHGSTDNITVIVLDLTKHTVKLRRKAMRVGRVLDMAAPSHQEDR